MKKPFFARHALLVLIVVFFCVPFAMRGSRYAVQRMKNDVQDWLPSDFPETAELDWFRDRFLGEQFVVISWEGCSGEIGDDRFKIFVDKLFPEIPPSAIRNGQRPLAPDQFADQKLGLYVRAHMPENPQAREDFIGNRLSLYTTGDGHLNWGLRQEKWLRSGKNEWVYITPNGELYQWKGNRAWPAQLWRWLRKVAGYHQRVEGEYLTSLGPIDGPWYYSDPRRLNARVFKSVVTGPSILSELTREMSRQEAHERLRGVLFGPHQRQTCIVVTLTEAGKQDPRRVVGRGILGKSRGVLLNIAEAAGVQPPPPPPMLPRVLAWMASAPPTSSAPMLRLGGPPVDNAAIDEEGQITLVRLLGLSLLVGVGLAWICFRSVNITIMVFLVGGIGAVTAVGLVYWTGSALDAVLMSMPSLVYVLGISGAVHIVNYYRESVQEHGLEAAPGRALRLGWAPCSLAAVTTSLGLISLATSNIIPIRKFGIYSAIGVIATLILLFTYLPAALEIWPPRRYLRRARASKGGQTASQVEQVLEGFWQGVGRWVIARYRLVFATCLCVLLVMAYGLSRIQTSIQLLKLFDGDAKIIRDYQWFEANLGKLVPMEIVIKVSPALRASATEMAEPEAPRPVDATQAALKLNFFERMEIAESASREIDRIFGQPGKDYMGRPMSANTFRREAPTLSAAREHFSKRLEENRKAFVDADYLRTDPEDDAELWRISLRLAALSDIDFGAFVQQIKMVLEPILSAYEYREIILRRLARESPRKQADRVLLVGVPIEQEGTSPSAVDRDQPEIDQTIIFARELHRLLRHRRVGVYALTADLADVQPTDLIVVLQDDPQISPDELAQTGAEQIDARDHRFDPARDRTALQRDQEVSAVYTGLVPIVYKAQRTLLVSLIKSTGLAFLMIAAVMMLILRSPAAGLLSMLPNVFPVVMIFGVMGWTQVLGAWTGRPDWAIFVDIGSMMTAGVAMGVAVDDTIHFLAWFRRGLDDGYDRKQSILLAYRRVATAMTQTTAIGGIGLSIFAFSTFTPTQRFGTLMLALLAAALIGDLLFLPALLASPFGRVFDKQRKKSSSSRGRSSGAAPHIGGESRQRATNPVLPPNVRQDGSHG